MKRISWAIAIATSSVIIGLNPIVARSGPAYGSYVGVGGNLGFSQSENQDGKPLGGVISVRYKMLEIPISLRSQALLGSGQAIVPSISYDLPLNWQTDAYVGAGVALPISSSDSPVGNKTSLVIQPGIDYSLPNSNAVLFGNAVVSLDAYEEGGGAAISIQGGVGWRF
ncbi:hypothetical protein [Merismopedia glauca]|uniref:Outer membrane protein beta-barrel domain-containing protein n=1 Tax=Merismopedia glauca CCAP 1448/3 TaxID=1296344 RepID=A0A2T1C1D2_9CYAN|nr:hypothetical protein [Merismopedia glauca]PSB02004.1 hypothetical protein C7B64_15260 [Merismopedia glauca CCAP 1448/3]